MFSKLTKFILRHKIATGLVVVVLVGGYWWHSASSTPAQTRYVLAAVQKGTLITATSGTGQVAVSDQVDIKPKVSGTVTYVPVSAGQTIAAGALLAQIDARDANKAVRDAQINLENAQITLQKLQINQTTSLPKLQDDITTAQNNLTQAYQNGFNEVANTFLDLPNIMTGIRGIIYDSTVGTSGQANSGAYQDMIGQYDLARLIPMINQAIADYLDSTTKYNTNLDNYKLATRYSTPEQIIALIDQTLETSKTMSQAVKDEQNILDLVMASLKKYQPNRNPPSALTQYQTDIAGYITKLNSHINSLTNIQNTVTSNQQTLASDQRQLISTQQSDPLDIASQQNAVRQREAALQDARDNLSDYSVRAPFAGVVAKINMKRGDSAGSGTALVTLITRQKVAEISLNEVDVAKINLGEKATLTFDAIDGLTIAGQVLEIDALGTVTQGVVTYNVKVGFATQDDRIKAGMSVSAAIITNSKYGTLLVANSAVKSSGGSYYVEIPPGGADKTQLLANGANSAGIFLTPAPQRQNVEIGLTNDTDTEIVSGLQEGDIVVVRAITTTAGTAASTQTRSLFPTPGRAAGGTGAGRGNATFGR